MHRFFMFAVAVSVSTCSFLGLNGCTGPEGPAGPQGPKGDVVYDTLVIRDTVVRKDTIFSKDTTIVTKFDTLITRDTILRLDTAFMNSRCGVCHVSDQRFPAKQFEWSMTGHSDGASLMTAGVKSSCARCHNGNGFMTQTVEGKAKTEIDTLNVSPIGCRTCHNLHDNYDTTDWKLTTIAKVGVAIKPADSIDMGRGNLCINCHQLTAINPVDTATTDSIKVTNRFGPHHGPQVSILLGSGGCESICTTPKLTDSIDIPGHLQNGCLDCHANKVEGKSHKFKPTSRAVATVSATINIDTSKARINVLLDEILDSLVARNILKKADTAAIGAVLVPAASGKMFTKAVAGACWNYMLICDDNSHGVHNYAYAQWLLQNTLAVLKQ